jgi:uracil DNA glycosylase superfamily protein
VNALPFCPGYPPPYDALVASYPDATVYPPSAFRVEWGPIFHRGRLDGTARLLVLGQDPAVAETVTRRILVGVAGQRTQGLLGRLGLTRSYVMVNTFVFSVYGQGGGNAHIKDESIAAYRNNWLNAIAGHNDLAAIITLGTLATSAYNQWLSSGVTFSGHHAAILHPTYPESASAAGQITLADATKRLLANWNDALPGLVAAIDHPDEPPSGAPYGTAFTAADLPPIPPEDLPAGTPAWMRTARDWAARQGADADTKRATVTVTVPSAARQWLTPPSLRGSGRRGAKAAVT